MRVCDQQALAAAAGTGRIGAAAPSVVAHHCRESIICRSGDPHRLAVARATPVVGVLRCVLRRSDVRRDVPRIEDGGIAPLPAAVPIVGPDQPRVRERQGRGRRRGRGRAPGLAKFGRPHGGRRRGSRGRGQARVRGRAPGLARVGRRQRDAVHSVRSPPVTRHHEHAHHLDRVLVVSLDAGSGGPSPDGVEPGLVAPGDHRGDSKRADKRHGLVARPIDRGAVKIVPSLDLRSVAGGRATDPGVELGHRGGARSGVGGSDAVNPKPHRIPARVPVVLAVVLALEEAWWHRLRRGGAVGVRHKVWQEAGGWVLHSGDEFVGVVEQRGPDGVAGGVQKGTVVPGHEVRSPGGTVPFGVGRARGPVPEQH